LKTVRGLIVSKWWREDNSLTLKVTIPVNSRGEVYIPLIILKNPVIKEGEKVIWKDDKFVQEIPEITFIKKEENYIVFNIGSGNYTFKVEPS
jgi:alpha-L-rhamnosidase